MAMLVLVRFDLEHYGTEREFFVGNLLIRVHHTD